MNWLHKLGDFDTNKILDSEPLALIKETSRKLSEAITLVDGVLSPTMKHKLANDIFVFSGFKTMHQLKEASLLLSDKDGIKPFSKFLSDVRKIDDAYNVRYLRAEYEFAVASVEMASRWEDFSDTEGVLLQYRTAEDDKVRASHREINRTTLPKSDPFWKKYYPPNDWGCRCTTVEVMEDDHPRTDSDEAMKNGENTLTTAKQKLFEFNAGAEQKVFPDKHPYYSCRIKGSCDKVNLAAKFGKNDLCGACHILNNIKVETRKNTLEYFNKHIKGKVAYNNAIDGNILLSTKGFKEALNQPHKFHIWKNSALKDIVEIIKNAKYVKCELEQKGNPMIKQYHYLETIINNEPSYIVIREFKTGEYYFYSMTDSIRK